VILELLLTAGADVALTRAISSITGFLQQDQLGRLLLLLHEEFGDQADLDKPAFMAWRRDENLAQRLLAVAEGSAEPSADESALAAAIADHLVRTEPGEVRPFSERIAEATRTLAPLAVQELPEATNLIVNRVDASEESLLKAMDALGRTFRSNVLGQEEGLGAALLKGPLDHAGARELVEEAEQKAEELPGDAGELLLAGADRLDDGGLTVLAEIYRARAAGLLSTAGEQERAAEYFESAAFGQISRGSSLARITINAFGRSALPADRWRVDALDSRLSWIGDARSALEALRQAVSESGQDQEWLAQFAELLVMTDGWEEILLITNELPDPEDPTNRLRIQLARAEAMSALHTPDADGFWTDLLENADKGDPEAAGRAWQRRGLRLALDDRPKEAQSAYRAAMERWNALPAFEEQVADCFYSALAVAWTAAMRSTDEDLMPLASELRGSTAVPAARAERLEFRAMASRLSGRLRDALFTYGQVLWIHRLSGSLIGLLATEERIAELLEQAERPQQALAHYLRAGKLKEAAGTLDALNHDQVEEILQLDGPGWVRAAEYGVIRRVAGTLSDDFVAAHLDVILTDAETGEASWLGPNPQHAAREAISAVAIQVPEASRGHVLGILRQEFRSAMPDGRKVAGRGLVLGTNVGLWDARDLAIEGFLAEPQFSGVDLQWIAEQARDFPEVMEQLISAAKEGSASALEAVALAGTTTHQSELTEIANTRIDKANSLKSVTKTETGTTVGMSDGLEDLGLVASLADPEHAEALASRLLELVPDDEEPEMHRASALGALYNMVDQLSREQLERLVKLASPLCLGEYKESPWDMSNTDPLSAFRIDLHRPNSLRAVALSAVARAEAKLGGDRISVIPRALDEALSSDDTTLLVGGLEASNDANPPAPPELVGAAMKHREARVRVAALRALIEKGSISRPVVELALRDRSAAVRQVLLQTDKPPEIRDVVREAMRGDSDAYLRALARRKDDAEERPQSPRPAPSGPSGQTLAD
jgi:hypothetical protein